VVGLRMEKVLEINPRENLVVGLRMEKVLEINPRENLVVGLRMEKVLEINPRENLVVGLRKELLEVLMQNQKKDFMRLKRKQKNNLFFISVN